MLAKIFKLLHGFTLFRTQIRGYFRIPKNERYSLTNLVINIFLQEILNSDISYKFIISSYTNLIPFRIFTLGYKSITHSISCHPYLKRMALPLKYRNVKHQYTSYSFTKDIQRTHTKFFLLLKQAPFHLRL